MSFVRKASFALLGLGIFFSTASVADASVLRVRRALVNKMADTKITGEYKEGRLGERPTVVGDIDGDGYEDYVVSHTNGVVLSDEDSSNAEIQLYFFYGEGTFPSSLEKADADAIAEYSGTLTHKSIVGVGDMDADGYDDVVFLDEKYFGSSSEPKVHVYYGDSTRLSGTFDIDDETVNLQYGSSISSEEVFPAGDVSGDGYADFLFYQYQSGVGEVHLIEGSSTRLTDTDDIFDTVSTSWGTSGDFTKRRFIQQATYGDLNGDGYDDVVLGYGRYMSNDARLANVLVYYGSASGFAATLDETDADYSVNVQKNSIARSGTTQYYRPFTALTANGDLNGDGYDDLAIGSTTRIDSYSNIIGEVALLYGASTAYSGSATFNSLPSLVGSEDSGFGSALSYANIDGDSYDDLLVTASQADLSRPGVFLFKGKSDTYSGVSARSYRAHTYFRLSLKNSSLEMNVLQTGDINGDGYDDMIFGVPYAKANGKKNAGRAFIVAGKTSRYGKRVFEGDSYITSVTNLRYGRVRVNYENGDSRRHRVFTGVGTRKTQVDTLDVYGYDTNYAVLRPNGKRVKIYGYNGKMNGTFLARTSGSPVARILFMNATAGGTNSVVVATLNGGTVEITVNADSSGYPQTDTATITGYPHAGMKLVERGTEFDITFLGTVIHTFSVDSTTGQLTQIL